MYDKYFLSDKQHQIITEWSQNNKVLLICGDSGVGKTSLARDILKDKVVTEIDTLNIKNTENLEDYLVNIISKRNISMMFTTDKRVDRGIIINNLDIFYKYDKRNFKFICNFLLRNNFNKTKVICICNTKFIINKFIKKINDCLVQLKYNNFYFHKIATNIVSKYDIELSFEQKNKLLIDSKYNLNTFVSNLEDTNNVNVLDNFDISSVLYKKIFTENLSFKDVVRLFEPEKLIISLNLLENMINYTNNISDISKIYNLYVHADIYEKSTLANYLINLYSIYTINIFHLLFRDKNIQINTYENNKYLSQSFIYIHNNKLIKSHLCYHDNIYLYLYLYLIDHNNLNVKKVLESITKDELQFYIKSFNEFYKNKKKFTF